MATMLADLTIPTAAIRAAIEKGARRRQSRDVNVREGLLVETRRASIRRTIDKLIRPSTVEDLGISCVSSPVPVVVVRARIMRTRAMFELP